MYAVAIHNLEYQAEIFKVFNFIFNFNNSFIPIRKTKFLKIMSLHYPYNQLTIRYVHITGVVISRPTFRSLAF